MGYRKFEAMGTEVSMCIFAKENETAKLDETEKTIKAFDEGFSRFRTDNELYALNNAGGKETAVSPMMGEMLRLSLEFHKETDGVFDPTVYGSLMSLGYDRRFKQIEGGAQDGSDPDLAAVQERFAGRIRMDQLRIGHQKAIAPAGFQFDSGGIGKGFIVDWIAANILSAQDDYWLSAGGDLVVSGNEPGKSGWQIDVQDPFDLSRNAYAILTRGHKLGIATSGVAKRKGMKGNYAWNHLIDPRSGLSIDNDMLAVTAISQNASKADVYAKTALLLGEEKGIAFLQSRADTAAIIFKKDGQAVFTDKMAYYLKIL